MAARVEKIGTITRTDAGQFELHIDGVLVAGDPSARALATIARRELCDWIRYNYDLRLGDA